MNKGNVIIVEDDLNLLNNSVEILNLEGFYTEGAVCANDFFTLLSTRSFDVAVVDVGLPDKSGFEVVEFLRENSDMGLIILTARDTIADKMKGYDSGADYYFVKPVDSRELVAAISNLLTRFVVKLKKDKLSADNTGPWLFSAANRVLISPIGITIDLTMKEQIFVSFLYLQKGKPVTRKSLLDSLGYSVDGPYGNRALDVLVVRLRKKIKDVTDEISPIKTVHAFGYSFGE